MNPNLALVVHDVDDVMVVVVGRDVVVDVSFPLDGGPRDSPAPRWVTVSRRGLMEMW